MDACTGEVIMSRHLKTRDGHQNRLIGLPSLIIMTLVFILMMDKFLNEMMYKYKLHFTYETLINESNGLDTKLKSMNAQLDYLSDPTYYKKHFDGQLKNTDSRDRLLVKRLSDWHFP